MGGGLGKEGFVVLIRSLDKDGRQPLQQSHWQPLIAPAYRENRLMTTTSQAALSYHEELSDRETRELICELCDHFYHLG